MQRAIFRLVGLCLSVVTVFAASATPSGNPADAKPAKRPNVVLIMADDLGWGDVAYHGNPKVHTPAIDQLAKDGVRLERFYVAPVCSPTRGSCMTGRDPNRYGTIWAGRVPLPRNELTIGDVMKRAGYRTGFFGKWHLGTLTPECDEGFPGPKLDPKTYSAPWHHGFDTCFAVESAVPNYNPLVWDDDWNLASTAKTANKYIMNRPLVYGEGTLVGKPLPRWPYNFWLGEHRPAPGPLAGDASALIAEPAIAFMTESVAQQEPFLAVVWFVTPHTPVAASPEDRAAYSQLSMREQHWFGAISALDRQVERIRDTLRKLGVEDDTFLVFCSDNGPSWVHELNSAGPFRGQKGDVYEGGIRVPAIVNWPRGLPGGGRTVDASVAGLDFLPTLAALGGVRLPDDRAFDGENMLPLLTGEATARTKTLNYDYPSRESTETWKPGQRRQMAVIEGPWKLVSVDTQKSFQLYNLVDDRSEKTDVAAAHPDLVARLRAEFSEWRSGVAREPNAVTAGTH